MKQLTAHEISSNFLSILKIVENGEHIVITGDNKYEKLAVIVPYKKYSNKSQRLLGPLKGKAAFKIKEDFKISDEELLCL